MSNNIDNHPKLKKIIKEWEAREAKAQQRYDRLKPKDKRERNTRTMAVYLIGKFRLHLVQIQIELADLRLAEIRKQRVGWYKLPKLPEVGRPIQFLCKVEPDSLEVLPTHGWIGTFWEGWRGAGALEPFSNDRIYAWRYLDEGLPMEPRSPVEVARLSAWLKGEEHQPPDSVADVSVADSVPSGKKIWGYNENGELVSEAGFKFLGTDSEGANEGAITISPSDGDVDIDLTTIRSQSKDGAKTVTITGPGQDRAKTTETVKLDGVKPVSTKKWFNLGSWGDDSEGASDE